MKPKFHLPIYFPSLPWFEFAGFALLILISKGH